MSKKATTVTVFGVECPADHTCSSYCIPIEEAARTLLASDFATAEVEHSLAAIPEQFRFAFLEEYFEYFIEIFSDKIGFYDIYDSSLFVDGLTTILPSGDTVEDVENIGLHLTELVPNYDVAKTVLFVYGKSKSLGDIKAKPSPASKALLRADAYARGRGSASICLADAPAWAEYYDAYTEEFFSLKPISKAAFNRLTKRYLDLIEEAHGIALFEAQTRTDRLILQDATPPAPIYLTVQPGLTPEEIAEVYREAVRQATSARNI